MACCVMSCHVVVVTSSCHVVLYYVLYYVLLVCYIILCHIISYQTMSECFILCCVVSYLVLIIKFSTILSPLSCFFRFLITAPLPRAVTGCGEMTHLIMNSIQHLQRIVKKQNEFQFSSNLRKVHEDNFDKKCLTSQNTQKSSKFLIPKDLSCWTNSVSRRTPVFVINLDRRPDRLQYS